jgi:hypothetical protein
MKRLLIYTLLIWGLFTICGCKKSSPTYSDTQIRVLNSTTWVFYDCTVDPIGTLSNNPSAKAFNYGQVNINTTSDYHPFDEIYKYAWFRLTMNSKTYYIKVFDYVGETPLAKGRYTYKIGYSATGDNLVLELITD